MGLIQRLTGTNFGSIELPEKMKPTSADVLSPLVAIVVSGVGALITTSAIGVASIPAGIVMALQDLLGGLTTFIQAFIAAFFAPFQMAASCAITAGAICNPPTEYSPTAADLAFSQANVVIEGANLLGFLAAVSVVGVTVYIVARVVSG